jgi:hypothetical protein
VIGLRLQVADHAVLVVVEDEHRDAAAVLDEERTRGR